MENEVRGANAAETAAFGGVAPAVHGESQKDILERTRFMERSLARLQSGVYRIYHERLSKWVPWRPEPWAMDFVRCLLLEGALNHVILKARQAYMSTLVALIALDWALTRPGFRGLLTAHRDDSAKLIFTEKTREPILHMRNYLPATKGGGKLWGDGYKRGCIQVNQNDVVITHNDMTTSQLLWEFPRGLVPNLIHMSEFAVLCDLNPTRAQELYKGASALQFCAKIMESTTAGEGGLFRDIYDRGEQARLSGVKQSRIAYRSWFWGWFWKAANRIPPAYPGQEDTNPDIKKYLDELDKENRRLNLHPPLDAGQRNFFREFLEQNFGGDWGEMWREFPSRASEAFKASATANYLAGGVRKAEAEGRVGDFPPNPQKRAEVAFDLGNEMALVWGEMEAGGYKIIQALALEGKTCEECCDIIEREGLPIWRLTFPHDANNLNKVSNNMTRTLKVTTREYFEKEIRRRVAAGSQFWRGVACYTVPKPGDEMVNIQAAREGIPRMKFHAPEVKASLVEPLKRVQLVREKTEGVVKNKVKKTTESHIHDAWVLLCRRLQEGIGDDEAKKRNEEILGVINATAGHRRVRGPGII